MNKIFGDLNKKRIFIGQIESNSTKFELPLSICGDFTPATKEAAIKVRETTIKSHQKTKKRVLKKKYYYRMTY